MLADTANLVVALKLDDKFSGPLRGVNRQLDTFTANATARGGFEKIGAGIGLGLKRGAVIGGLALAGLSTQIKAGVDSLRELENVNAQTVAGLESTGGASGQTLESIRKLSEEYETLGGVIDDKVIQSGANVLLTFRRVDKKAFEPALEQALNLSTAMGTDLQTAILQVGKALDDPVRGVTALRRAGVQLSDEQQKQIKTLVEQNDLYGAQQIILEELERQVGGRFEAAGKTNEATVARMGDAWEDLQMTLATAFLPAIDRIATRLTEIFSDPAVMRGVEDFGEQLAGFLTDENLKAAEDAVRNVFGYIAGLPWSTIGSGLKIAGDAAKTAVDAFMSLPPGVQQGLITLLAANKLTGGLVASGLGELLKVGLKSLTTIMAGNVTVIGKSVTGGGGGGGLPAGKGGGGGGLFRGLGRGLLTGGVVGGAAVAAGAAGVMTVEYAGNAEKAANDINSKLDKLPRSTGAEIDASIARIEGIIDSNNDSILDSWISTGTGLNQRLDAELAELKQQKAESNRQASSAAAQSAAQLTAARNAASASDRTTGAVRVLASVPHNVNVDNHVSVNAHVGVSVMNMMQARQRTATFFTQSTNSAGI